MKSERRSPLLAWLVIAGAATLTFARALPFPLQRSWDDGRFILDDPSASHTSWSALVGFFTEARFEAYHPLHLLSYWLDVPWFGPEPLVLHTVNLGLWVVALCLLHACLRELKLSAAGALIGTLLVGLHPVQVEAVSWATGRKDVLAMLFACASLLLHLRSATPWGKTAWACRGFFLLAALSKTTTLPLPLFAYALDVLLERRSRRDAWTYATPSLALAATLGLLTVSTWQENEMVRTTLGGPLAAPLRLLGTLAHQMSTALWPARVSPMYATEEITTFSIGWFLWPAALGGVALLGWRAGAKLATVGVVGFLLLLLPASNLVPMYFPLQDRYLSLPIIGLAVTAAALADAWAKNAKSRLPHALLAALCLGLAARTVDYQGVWQSETRLWGHAASTQPDAGYAWLKLSEVRRDAGNFEGAISAARAFVSLAPGQRLAWSALFEDTALRDEHREGLKPSRAREFAKRFYNKLDDPDALRALASELLDAGYIRALELPLACSLVLAPLPDTRLEAAARSQLHGGRRSVARFYVHRMQGQPMNPYLADLRNEPYFSVLP